jgi:threonine dehydrogenase-like Zn-dependent dehydrogenase
MAGQVVVDVARVGLCGTDVEFYSGEMAYLHDGHATYPIRLGHEWSGRVSEVGPGVDPAWLGRRVTGDTMIGCGHCSSCRAGRHRVCAERFEVGVRGGYPGALAEQLAVPASGLVALPDEIDDQAGAMIEPGGNALRAVEAAAPAPGLAVLVLGAGTIGLLAAMLARAHGAEVQLAGRSARSVDFARRLGFSVAGSRAEIPDRPWASVIDASTDPTLPALALDLVAPAGRLVLIGLASLPSQIDSRQLVFKDVTAIGILSASGGLAATVDHVRSGAVDPRPLVAATVGLDRVADVLAGWRPEGAGLGPKIQVNPRA